MGLLSSESMRNKSTSLRDFEAMCAGKRTKKNQQQKYEESLDHQKHACVMCERQKQERQNNKKPELFRQSKKRDPTRRR